MWCFCYNAAILKLYTINIYDCLTSEILLKISQSVSVCQALRLCGAVSRALHGDRINPPPLIFEKNVNKGDCLFHNYLWFNLVRLDIIWIYGVLLDIHPDHNNGPDLALIHRAILQHTVADNQPFDCMPFVWKS